jgi:F-type H+-transporting ATPase subunit gamma
MLATRIFRSFAANEKILKRRMRSVGNIGKITKAMKMVAASKMRLEHTRLSNGGDFGHSMAMNWFEDDETAKKFLPVYTAENKTLIVPITTDKGLCGGINSNVVRDLKETLRVGKRDRYVVFPVGEKGTAALVRPFADILHTSITNLVTPVSYSTASSIGHYLEAAMKEHGCDRMEIIYT